MQINKRSLGSGGLEITTLGFGAWAIGGGDMGVCVGGPRMTKPRKTQCGVPSSLESIGSTPQRFTAWAIPKKLWVVLCVRYRPLSGRSSLLSAAWFGRPPNARTQASAQAKSIRAECEASLRRLGIERIDLYQFHWPDETGTPIEDSWAEMLRLIEEGKVRLGGVSNFDVGLLERCSAIRHVDSLQPPFSLIRRDAAAQQIPW